MECGHETATSHLLLGGPAIRDLGSLAGRRLSGCGVRSGCVGSDAASQALQAGLRSVLEADSINLAAATMVTGANCRLAQVHLSGETSKAGVTRDDLSQPVHSGARRA